MRKAIMLIAIVLIVLVAGRLLSGPSDQAGHNTNQESEQQVEESVTNQDNQINTQEIMSEGNKTVRLTTNKGDITIELFADKAPETVGYFIKHTEEGLYDGTRFHRVIADFMIQGGDPLSRDEAARSMWGTGGPDYKFNDEPNDVALEQGVIAMANAGPNTNGSQFFIITAEATPWLQGKHTGFGRVIDGMDVVNVINSVETAPNDQPLEDVVVEKVEVL